MDCDGGLAQWQQKTCRSLRLGEINSLTFQAKYHEEVLERSCSLHATEGGLPSRRNRCSKGRAVRLRSSPGDGRGRSGPKNLALEFGLAYPPEVGLVCLLYHPLEVSPTR